MFERPSFIIAGTNRGGLFEQDTNLWLWSDLLATMQRFLHVYDLIKGNQLYALNELLVIIKCECGRPKSLNESFADGEITQKIVGNFSCVPYPHPDFFWRAFAYFLS